MSIAFIYPSYLWLLLLVPLTLVLGLLGRRTFSRLRQWGGLGLRVLLLVLIVLALAGIQLRVRADTLSAVFVLDASDSISQEEQARGEAFIHSSVGQMPVGDRAAVVVFGENALVERLATEERSLPRLASVPVTTRTDIAGALQLALALFPEEGAKRLVLLSDGRENLNYAMEQAELASLQGIELVYVPLGQESGDTEVLVKSLDAPSDVREGQEFDLNVLVDSTAAMGATLRLFGDGELLYNQEVRLQQGTNRFSVPVEAGEAGFRRFRAVITPDSDTRLQNNEASAFTVVSGPPHILIVEGQPGEAENLASALQAAQMRVDSLPASQMPNTLAEMAAYDAIVLANVPAKALSEEAMNALPVYVSDLGKGLLMTGGENSFGAGGYLRTPLEKAMPVSMDVRNKEMSPNLALVLAIDKSGSMGRCHCDNPDLNQSYTRRETGQPKVDIAKEAIMRAASALGDQDYLGVLTFDSQPRWALEISQLVDPYSLEQLIGGVQAEGQTNLEAGVKAAYEALQGVDAKRKHIILMTDGWVNEGDLAPLARQMEEQGITLSVVAAGGGSALYLQELSDLGGGTYYPAQDILSVPDIFLKETVTSVGEYIIEEPFFPLPAAPSPVLRGLDPTQLPGLFGYNGTTPKNTARNEIVTPRGDPLLSSWQYGLGRAVAWTSDLKGKWASQWLNWEGFPRFASQLVGWTLPAPGVEGLSAKASVEGGQAAIRLEALDDQGTPLNFLKAQATIIDPDLNSQQVALEQVGAGQYLAQLDASQPGTYLVRLGVNQDDQSLGQLTLGMVVPYSPEYAESGADLGLLEALARATGGGALLEAQQAFVHDLPAADFAAEIWRPLLLAVALLFPLDVAVRRVRLGREDLVRAREWLEERLPQRPQQGTGERRVLGQLFEARQRARQRQSGSDVGEVRLPPHLKPNVESRPKDQAAEKGEKPRPESPDHSGEDPLARLRAAKRRARRDRP